MMIKMYTYVAKSMWTPECKNAYVHYILPYGYIKTSTLLERFLTVSMAIRICDHLAIQERYSEIRPGVHPLLPVLPVFQCRVENGDLSK